jgi:hypothetical protein
MVEVNRESMVFEVLHRLLVFLRRGLCLERAEISSFARLWIFLTGIHPILARFQFPDHEPIEYSQTEWAPRAHQKIFWAANEQPFGEPRLEEKARAARRELRDWSAGEPGSSSVGWRGRNSHK